MKILLVSPFPPPEGGIATWTVGFSEYCKVKKMLKKDLQMHQKQTIML